MKQVRLMGDLERFKSHWEIDVKTPSEAMRAIEANRPGFIAAADAGEYVLILANPENMESARQVTLANALGAWSDETLFVVPRASGEEPFSATMIMGWSIAMTGTIVMSTATATFIAATLNMLVSVAISLAVSMVASLISGGNDGVAASEMESHENRPSYILNGVVNTSRQGHRVPLLYGGPILVGSMLLSSQVHVKDIPV